MVAVMAAGRAAGVAAGMGAGWEVAMEADLAVETVAGCKQQRRHQTSAEAQHSSLTEPALMTDEQALGRCSRLNRHRVTCDAVQHP